ncbi:MAG: hypothetical protein OJF50_006303 [Nitrospira sp.]|jgi:hypothetical protein|nr:hypothetical protein [Nitrospira sp.]
MEWTWLSYILNVVLGVMGMYVALDGDWAKRHKVLTMLLFFTLTIGSVTASYFVDKESQKRLDGSHKELVAAIQTGNADLQKVQNKNLELSEKSMDLQAKNAELQKELAEKAELERKRQIKIETEREAALKSRNVNFATPFNALKKQARGEIRLMHEATGPHSTDFFRERAVQWLRFPPLFGQMFSDNKLMELGLVSSSFHAGFFSRCCVLQKPAENPAGAIFNHVPAPDDAPGSVIGGDRLSVHTGVAPWFTRNAPPPESVGRGSGVVVLCYRTQRITEKGSNLAIKHDLDIHSAYHHNIFHAARESDFFSNSRIRVG